MRQAGDTLDKPRLSKVRLAQQRAGRAHQGFLRAVEPAQRHRAVGQELRVAGGELQCRVVSGKRLRHPIELEQRIAAIAERIEVGRGSGEQTVEARKRLTRALELQERHAAAVEELAIVRFETQAFVVADQRASEIFQRMKHQPEAGKAVGATKIALQRRLDERERRIEPPALVIDQAKTVQRVEIAGVMLQQRGIKPFRFGELAFLHRTLRAPQHSRKVRLQKLR